MDDITRDIAAYFDEWDIWCAKTSIFPFNTLKPVHAGWKVPDEKALGVLTAQLLPFTSQGHIGTVDNRKIILMGITEAIREVPILQLMQLSPNSTDPLGLDHVAFYCKEMGSLEKALSSSSNQWEKQQNIGHSWISLWFGPHKREAKFFDHTSLDLGSKELHESSVEIIRSITEQ